MARSLFDRSVYTTSLPYYRNLVYSYDMRSAGLSVLREKGLVSREEGERLAALPKQERVVTIGKMCREDGDLVLDLENGIKDAVYEFCRENDIQEEDIISIKKDALYTTKPASHLNYGEYIRWVEQQRYHCFYNFREVEVYFVRNGPMDVKGLTEEGRQLHRQHWMVILQSLLSSAMSENIHTRMLAFRSLRRKYLRQELFPECYREFNRNSKHRWKCQIGGLAVYADQYNPELEDITYNYQHVLVPVITSMLS